MTILQKRVEYIYAICDPRLPETRNVVYIGQSPDPAAAVLRHLKGSSNGDVYEWAKSLAEDFPEGLEVDGTDVLKRWLGEKIPEPITTSGRTRLVWKVLGTNPPQVETDENGVDVFYTKLDWVRLLVADGHPVMNKFPGRPIRPDQPFVQLQGEPEGMMDDE